MPGLQKVGAGQCDEAEFRMTSKSSKYIKRWDSYRVTCSELLLSAQNGTGTLSSVELSLATDNSLALSSTAVGAASNLGNGIPVVHSCGLCGVVVCDRDWYEIEVVFDRGEERY